jgi:hypothetical protein
MTVTVCWGRPANWRPGRHVNRWGKRLRSVRVWWLWVAVAWYRFDDRVLVMYPHDWSDT